MQTKRDQLFSRPQPMLVDFQFNEQVAAVFPDMIRRSVPGYGDIIALLGLFASRYLQPKSYGYDLGCSLGASTLSMVSRTLHHDYHLFGVDNSLVMLQNCRQNLQRQAPEAPITLICSDIRDITPVNASLVVINFTLQFIPPAERLALLHQIYTQLLPGGALMLAEKICFEQPAEQQWQESMQLAFKQANGYSNMEISRKRAALENVLFPDPLTTHYQRLQQAGFSQIHLWYQCFNFAALVAIK
ncbi:carboxy-S-adenosyl-L-methionine synthase CmoA [Ectothiorhodospiraceae bacterium BW-2]|nr:carboxy-S-adenosyl-L-methionine synthase CmoA [Ectothiorhodospiraceae bacterium BW-2]